MYGNKIFKKNLKNFKNWHFIVDIASRQSYNMLAFKNAGGKFYERFNFKK